MIALPDRARRPTWAAALGVALRLLRAAFMLVSSLALTAPAGAAEAPAEDTGWGTTAFESEAPRYAARVEFYEDEGKKLRLRLQLVTREVEAFMANQGSASAADLSARYLQTDDARNRTLLGVAADAAAHDAKARYDAALAETPDRDAARNSGVRAKLWLLHLDMLRLANEATRAELAYEDSRGVILRSLTTNALGIDFDDWMNDNYDDVVYVVTEGAADALWNLAANCIGSFSASYLASKLGVPPDWAATAVDCVKSTVLDSLLVFWTTTWRKQFVDALAAESIPGPVAEYWWSEFLKPEDPASLRSRLRAAFDDIRNEITKASVKEFVKELAVREIAGEVVKRLRENFGIVPATKPAIGWLHTSLGGEGRFRKIITDSIERHWFKDLMRDPDDLKRLYPNLLQRLELIEQGWKWGSERALLFMNYHKWMEIKPDQIARFRDIRDCIVMSGGGVVAEEIVAKLKLPARDYAAFLKTCREPQTPAEAAALDRARAILAEVSGRLARLKDESAHLAGELAAAEQDVGTVVADATREVDAAAEAVERLCKSSDNRRRTSESDQSRIEAMRLAANRLADAACSQSEPAAAEKQIALIERRLDSATWLLAGMRKRSGNARSELATMRTPVDFAGLRTRLGDAEISQNLVTAARSRINPERKTLEGLLNQAKKLLDGQRGLVARGLLQQISDMTIAVIVVTPFKESDIARLKRSAAAARKSIDELEKRRSSIGDACPAAGVDTDKHVRDLDTIAEAAAALVAATAGEKDRAAQCLADLRSGLAANAALVASIRAAIAACEWSRARSLMERLPESSQVQAALGATSNELSDTDARANTLVDRARELRDRGNLRGALAELKRAEAIAACRTTADAIESLRASIELAAVAEGEDNIAACEFDRADELAAALRPDKSAVRRLIGRIAAARALEKDLTAEIAALSTPAAGRWVEALAGLKAAGDKTACASTRGAVAEAADKVVADGTGRADAVAKACDIGAMRALSAALGGHSGFAAAKRALDAAYNRESTGASVVERAASELAAGNLDAAAASARAVLDADPPARCSGDRARSILEEVEKARAAKERADNACKEAAAKLLEARTLAESGALGAAERALAAAKEKGCPATGPEEAATRARIDSLVEKLIGEASQAAGACDGGFIADMQAKLQKADHARLGAAVTGIGQGVAVAAAALAGLGDAERRYIDGEFDAALGRLTEASNRLDGVGALPVCPVVKKRIDDAREKVVRIRDNIEKIGATIAACDAVKMAAYSEQIKQLTQPHPALVGFVAQLDRTGPVVSRAVSAFDRGKITYEEGRLGAARAALEGAAADLRMLEGDPECAQLAKRIQDGLSRIDTLEGVLGKADTAMRECQIGAIDQWLARFRASPSHILIRDKIPALQEAGARCATSGVDAAVRRCDLPTMRQLAAGLSGATLDPQQSRARDAIREAMPRCLQEVALKQCRASFGELARVINAENENDVQCGCEQGAGWNSDRTRCVRADDGDQRCKRSFGEQAMAVNRNPDGTYNCICVDGYWIPQGSKACVRDIAPSIAVGNSYCERTYGKGYVATSYRKFGQWNCAAKKPPEVQNRPAPCPTGLVRNKAGLCIPNLAPALDPLQNLMKPR